MAFYFNIHIPANVNIVLAIDLTQSSQTRFTHNNLLFFREKITILDALLEELLYLIDFSYFAVERNFFILSIFLNLLLLLLMLLLLFRGIL